MAPARTLRVRPPRPDGHPRARPGRAGLGGRGHPSDPGLSLPPDRPGPLRGPNGTRDERQEGPVDGSRGDGGRGREGPRRRGPHSHGDGAGHVLRVRRAGRGHEIVRADPLGVRRFPWCSTEPTRSSGPEGPVARPEATPRPFPRSSGARWRPAATTCSSRLIRTRPRPRRTVGACSRSSDWSP